MCTSKRERERESDKDLPSQNVPGAPPALLVELANGLGLMEDVALRCDGVNWLHGSLTAISNKVRATAEA